MVERVNQDPTFAEQLVKDLLRLKEENEGLKHEVEALKGMEKEAQHALRQARGISSYLKKSKQGQLQKTEKEAQIALRQAKGISWYLKSKNDSLQLKLKEAERVETEAQHALRQARGVSAYLKSKNADLEKKMAAAKSEKHAHMALRQAEQNSINLRSTLKEKGLLDESDHSQPSVMALDDEAWDRAFTINDKVGMIGLALVGVIIAMQ